MNEWTNKQYERLAEEMLFPKQDKTEPKAITLPKCTCENIMAGCKCGAFLQEKILEEEIKKKAEKDNEDDIRKGVPYEERQRKYGHILKTV